MDSNDCVNIFLSEGAGMDTIVREIEPEVAKYREMHLAMFVLMK